MLSRRSPRRAEEHLDGGLLERRRRIQAVDRAFFQIREDLEGPSEPLTFSAERRARWLSPRGGAARIAAHLGIGEVALDLRVRHIAASWEDAERALVIQQREPHLLQLVHTLRAPGRFTGRLHRGEQQRHQDPDDRDDDQQFNECKARG
jgi:hypothetical protein